MKTFEYLRNFRANYPWHRTSQVCFTRSKALQNVNIVQDEFSSITFDNVRFCGSVFTCKNCASIITHRRRAELNLIIERSKLQNMSLLLVTYTIPHKKGIPYARVLSDLKLNRSLTRKGKAWSKFEQNYNIIGTISGFEFNYSLKNGHHPHYHDLMILKNPLPNNKKEKTKHLEEISDFINQRYIRIAKRDGRPIPKKNVGVNVIECQNGATYLSKWGLDFELTSQHLKTTKDKNSYTLGEVFAEAKNIEDPKNEIEEIQLELFKVGREFINHNSARALTWSNHLKAFFEIPHISDDEYLKKYEKTQKKVIASLDGFVYNKLRQDNHLNALIHIITITKDFTEFAWVFYWLENYDYDPKFEDPKNEQLYQYQKKVILDGK